MKTVKIREFKINSTKYLSQQEPLVITRYGKPISVITPVKESDIESIFLRIEQILTDANISKETALLALEQIRKDIYEKNCS